MASQRVKKVMTMPVHIIFEFLQQRARVQVWLFDNATTRMEGRIIGFDEFMNLTMDDAEELDLKKKTRRSLGRILLKGDNVGLIMRVGEVAAADGAAA